MNNDRELLELAAKAAGIAWWDSNDTNGLIKHNGILWNPLTDDGDALRLAVKLELEICFNNQEEGTTVWCPAIGDWLPEKHGDDPYAATRRAIVRAAAEIGRTM